MAWGRNPRSDTLLFTGYFIFYMSNVEYAYIAQPAQFNYKKTGDRDISAYHQTLVNGYDEFEQELNRQSHQLRQQYAIENRSFHDKTCMVCDAKLRFISSHGFWGCPNYSDGRKHTTFQDKYEPHLRHVRVSRDWVTEIIRAAGIQDKVKAKEAMLYFTSIGLPDLREQYGLSNTMGLIDNFVKAKERSLKQERQAEAFLSSIYPTVLSQQTIKYKLYNQPETFCIPDFICSSEFEVMIVDAKLDVINNEQMDLYTSLIKFMMDKKGDDRPVNGGFILYDYTTHITYQPNTKYQIFKIKQDNG